jgi:NitT/TauT family transport system substrate-binding protein
LVDANLAIIGFEDTRDVTAIASVTEKTDDAIVARADRGISTPGDLAGRRIAYLPGTSSHVFLRQFQRSQGLDLSGAELIPLAPPAMQAALINGDVDAISVWQPFRFNAVTSLGSRAIQFENGGVYRARVYLTARKSALAPRADAYRRVLRALIQAEDYARTNREATITFLAEAMGVDRAALAESWDQYILRVGGLGSSNHLEVIGHDMTTLDTEYLGRTIPDYSRFWSPEVLQSVDAERANQ